MVRLANARGTEVPENPSSLGGGPGELVQVSQNSDLLASSARIL
jgi:hypothetical protein